MRGVVVAFLVAGCASPAVNIVQIAANTGSFVATEKTISDHVLSAARGQDCAIFRMIDDQPVCQEYSAMASVEIHYNEEGGRAGAWEGGAGRGGRLARGRLRPAVMKLSYQKSCLTRYQWRKAVMNLDEFENRWELATLPPRCAPTRVVRKLGPAEKRHQEPRLQMAALGPPAISESNPAPVDPGDVDVMGMELAGLLQRTVAGDLDLPPRDPETEANVQLASLQPVTEDGKYLYRLGAGDKIRLTVFGEDNLSGEFQVGSAGKVSLPLIGSVAAGGRSLKEFTMLVEARFLDGYLKNPKVSTQVMNYRPVFVLGEVKNPGSYEYVHHMTVMQAVALAGGFTYRANERKIKIDRRILVPDLNSDGGHGTLLLPGDVVRIPERFF